MAAARWIRPVLVTGCQRLRPQFAGSRSRGELQSLTDARRELVRPAFVAALDSAIHDFLFALQEESDSGGALRVRVRGKDVAPASALTANRRTSPSACERAVSRDLAGTFWGAACPSSEMARSSWCFVRCLALALLAVVAPGVALADELRGTRGQELVEVAHVVDATLDEGVATYRVRRSFANRGTQTEEARLEIALPYGAVATGLRIQSGARWFEGALMHRDKAEELYRELTGLGPSEPKDPALLYWRWSNALALRVFPIFAGKTSTIEYTLTVPTEYEDGVYSMSYPRRSEAKNLATPLFRVRTRGVREVFVDGEVTPLRDLRLGEVRLHPLLEELGIENPRVLVRSLSVPTAESMGQVKLTVDIAHTWQGDIQLDLVDPAGELLPVREHDLSLNDNDLKREFVIDYQGPLQGTWHLLVTDHHPLDGGTLRSWSLAPVRPGNTTSSAQLAVKSTKPAAIPQPYDGSGSCATIGVRPGTPDGSHVRLGRVALVPGRHFARVEVDVARRLSALPERQSTVFVLDLSHTMGPTGIEAQLRLVRAYLSHVPDAEFALVGVRRFAEALTGFLPASQIEATLSRLENAGELRPGNGSFLDRGAALAVDLLRGRKTAPPSSAVLLMTDNRLRKSFSESLARGVIETLPSNTVVHVAEVRGEGGLILERDDTHRLFPWARARGGVMVRASGVVVAKSTELAREALYLVRPNRIDHPVFTQFGSPGPEQLAGALREGESIRWMALLDEAPRTTELRGQLWSRPWALAARQSEPFHRATAGFVFSLDHYTDLSEPEQFVIASYARAVSPVTSYLAIEPGVRPSTDGFEEGVSGLGFGAGHGRLGGSGFARAVPIDWSKIQQGARDACSHHGATSPPAPTRARVEVQDRETADVTLLSTETPFAACVVEWLWAHQLPAGVRGDVTKTIDF